MKVTINAFADEASKVLAEQIEAMKANGVSGLEIRGVDGENISKISAAKAKEIRKMMDDSGLSVWSIGSPTGKIKITDPFAPHFDEFKHMLELANILGASKYRLFSFYGCQSAEYKDDVMEKLNLFCDAAEGSGVYLCHENEKDIYGEKAPECLEIVKCVPRMGVIFDPANYVQSGQDTLEAWKLLGPYVTYMHIKDAMEDGSVVPAGKGAGNVAYILGEYIKAGGNQITVEPHLSVFDGFGQLETEKVTKMNPYTYKSNKEAFAAAVAAARELIG
ncbi:MAG: sugar phosphate isomerase/epimerase [Oscillospiraceae bacterium]|nr:sugar phosphate isomerase/epimerase [Oscillospiraceae bacterium]